MDKYKILRVCGCIRVHTRTHTQIHVFICAKELGPNSDSWWILSKDILEFLVLFLQH